MGRRENRFSIEGWDDGMGTEEKREAGKVARIRFPQKSKKRGSVVRSL